MVISIIDEMHRLRKQAQTLEMHKTEECIRKAIIEAAIELDCPTQLNARDLLKGRGKSAPSSG